VGCGTRCDGVGLCGSMGRNSAQMLVQLSFAGGQKHLHALVHEHATQHGVHYLGRLSSA
jgi:hypothetical protein